MPNPPLLIALRMATEAGRRAQADWSSIYDDLARLRGCLENRIASAEAWAARLSEWLEWLTRTEHQVADLSLTLRLDSVAAERDGQEADAADQPLEEARRSESTVASSEQRSENDIFCPANELRLLSMLSGCQGQTESVPFDPLKAKADHILSSCLEIKRTISNQAKQCLIDIQVRKFAWF
ncbi:unnamed protein product [Protopolystoma xenopodis]|uniref:Uncharacterized protein n=1 Tax=Protopolystoma xenopodis TaxID=117903 RepID=A0A3S5CKK8_9PLAT|nr:unnamed protein product [Protopolystoma xenopodis]